MTARRLKPLLPAIGAFLLVFALSAHAAHAGTSYTAATSGDWNSPSTWAGGIAPTTVNSGDFVTIPAALTVTISSADSVTDNGGFIFVHGGGSLQVGGILVGTGGQITVNGGFSVSGSATFSGLYIYVNGGGSINVLGGGTLTINGGGIDMEYTSSPLSYAEASVANGGTLDNTGYITVYGGGDNNNAITNEGTFNNNPGGTVSISGGHFYNDANFNNAPGAFFNTYDDLENSGSFLNAGSLYLGAGGVESSGSFTNSGTTLIGYPLIFDSTGPFVNANGGTVNAAGTLSVGPSNSYNKIGGTINVNEGVLENDGGTMTNDGSIIVGPSPGSTFNNFGGLNNNPDGSLTVQTDGKYVGGALTNNGAITNEGRFDSGGLENYASITNGYGGQFTISSSLDYLFNNIGATVTNDNGGTLTVGIAGAFENLGTINNYGLISSAGSGSIISESSFFYNYCPTGSVTATLTPDPILPYNVGCTLTFEQYTLASGQEWGVTVKTLSWDSVGGVFQWVTVSSAHYTGTGGSIQVPNLTGQGFSYSFDTPINDGQDITFNCADTVLLPFTGSYYACSGSGTAIFTGPATVLGVYSESYHIPTTTTISPSSASILGSNPSGVAFTVTVADSNTAVSSAPNGAVTLSDGGAGGAFGDPYGDGPGSYYANCLGEVDSYTSQCQFTYYPNPIGSSTTTVTITATFEGDGYHLGSSATASVTVTYYIACPQVPNKGGANLKGANLQGCELAGYNLSGDNLMGANMASADLTGANLQGANMKGVNLANSILQGADLKGANLMGATLDGDQAQNANFQGANLKGDSLQNGNFSGASFQGANMMDDNLSYSDFDGANFTGANTNGDTTTGATFVGAINPP